MNQWFVGSTHLHQISFIFVSAPKRCRIDIGTRRKIESIDIVDAHDFTIFRLVSILYAMEVKDVLYNQLTSVEMEDALSNKLTSVLVTSLCTTVSLLMYLQCLFNLIKS